MRSNLATWGELSALAESLWVQCQRAFDAAALEPKHDSRAELLARLSPPELVLAAAATSLVVRKAWGISVDGSAAESSEIAQQAQQPAKAANKAEKKDVMRKHMNRVVLETLEKHPNAVYIGEDVRHGGCVYYCRSSRHRRQTPPAPPAS